MSDTVLLVGGPADGRTYQVINANQEVIVAVPPKMSARWFSRDKEIEPSQSMEVGKVVYLPTKIRLWGTVLVLHVAMGTPEERIEATVHTHLLTPLAHSLMRGVR